MLERLTPEMETKIEEVRQFWLDFLFSCKHTEINREAAKIGIDWMYKMAGLDEPVVIYVDSPLGQQYAVAYLKEFTKTFPKLFNGGQVSDQVAGRVLAQVRNQVSDQVSDQVAGQLWGQVLDRFLDRVSGRVRGHVEDQVRGHVEDQVRDHVAGQVHNQVAGHVLVRVAGRVLAQVWDQVLDRVRDQVAGQVAGQVAEYHSTTTYGNIEDYGWVSFYDFFTQIGVINHNGFNEFKNLLLSGVYDMIQLKGFCIVSSLPEIIIRNNQNQLHCEDGPSIKWKDGYELHFWNGVAVPKEWIEHPESITKEALICEKNAEKRRCLREIIGTQRFAELLGITEIDRDHVNGQDVILYRTKSEDDIIGKHIYYVKVICHSTLREYFLCVPETAAGNAWQAVAWTFGKTSENYMPLVES